MFVSHLFSDMSLLLHLGITKQMLPMVRGYACSNDMKRYTSGSTASRRVNHAKLVNGEETNEKRHPGPPEWGF